MKRLIYTILSLAVFSFFIAESTYAQTQNVCLDMTDTANDGWNDFNFVDFLSLDVTGSVSGGLGSYTHTPFAGTTQTVCFDVECDETISFAVSGITPGVWDCEIGVRFYESAGGTDYFNWFAGTFSGGPFCGIGTSFLTANLPDNDILIDNCNFMPPVCMFDECPAGPFEFDTDPGVCTALRAVPKPTVIGPDCGGSVTLYDEDFEAGDGAGWTTSFVGQVPPNLPFAPCADLLINTAGQYFSADCTTTDSYGFHPSNTTGVKLVMDDDSSGAGVLGTGTVSSPPIDVTACPPTGLVELTFDWDFFGAGATFSAETFDGGTWNPVFSVTGGFGITGSEVIDVTADAMSAGANFAVRFNHNDNGGWEWGAGIDNVNVTCYDASLAISVDATVSGAGTVGPLVTLVSNGQQDLDGDGENEPAGSYCVGEFEKGTSTLTFSIPGFDPADTGMCSYDVVVSDAEPPVITCPDDIIVDLAPGDCDALIEYEIEGTDNCPPVLLGSLGFDPGAGTGLFFTQGFCPGETGYGSMFDVTNNGAGPMEITSVDLAFGLGQTFDNGCGFFPTLGPCTGGVEIYIVTVPPGADGPYCPVWLLDDGVAWTLADSYTVNAGGLGVALNLPISDVVLEPGQTVGLFVTTDDSGCGGVFTESSSSNVTDGVLALTLGSNIGRSSKITGGTNWANVLPAFNTMDCWATASIFPGGPWTWPGSVNYSVALPEFPIGITGPLSGEILSHEDSPYTVTASITDCGGTTETCSFQIFINEYDDETESLTCNDNVNISLDTDCMAYVTADMFLEGGPYRCYLTGYEVYFSNNPDLNVNGMTVDIAMGSYTVTVVDAETGNSCWGTFNIEDKIAPVVIANDITVNCLMSVPYVMSQGGELTYSLTDFGQTSGAQCFGAGGDDATFEIVNPCGGGQSVVDISVDLTMEHTFLADLDITLTSPDGTTITLFDANCGADNNMDVNFNDGGADAAASCVGSFTDENCTGTPPYGSLALSGSIAPADALSTFVGENACGTWTLNIDDMFGGDDGKVDFFAINLITEGGVPTITVDSYLASQGSCGAVDVASSDVSTPRDCDSGLSEVITRTWVVTDGSGNTASTSHSVFVERVGLGDIIGDAGEIDENGNFSVNPDPIAPGEIRWPARVVAKLTCGDDTTPQGIYDLCSYYVPDGISTECDQQRGIIDAHNAAVMASYPHYITIVPVPGSGCGVYNYLVPIKNEVCNLLFTYSDQTLPACGNDCKSNEKVIRLWTVLDWCAADTETHTQIIKAADNEAPTFVGAPTQMGASVNPWGCVATAVLPPVVTHDNCDEEVTVVISTGTPGVVVSGGIAYNLPKSMDSDGDGDLEGVIIVYTATDCCGNETSHQLEIEVVDSTPPVPITKENIVISLTVGPNQQGGDEGSAKLFVGSVDNGSHDGDCGPVRIAVRRASDAPDCDNLGTLHAGAPFNNNTTYFNFSNLSDNQQPADHDQHDTDEGQYVKFCCEDLNDVDPVSGVRFGLQEVWLGVWDDANMDGTPGTIGDNFNESWANVRVESKLDPVILVPPMGMVQCYDDPTDPNVITTVLGSATAGGLCAAESTEYTDVCGWDQNGDGDFDDIFTVMGRDVAEAYNKACNYGPIVRTWCVTGTDICGVQIVIVKSPDDVFRGCNDSSITWPYEEAVDAVFDANNGSALGFEEGEQVHPLMPANATLGCLIAGGNAGYAEVAKLCESDFDTNVTWVAENCSLIGHSVDSTIFYFEADACLKIIYEHTIIDWCQYNPNDGTNTGVWTWTVIGKVIDDTAPEITLPERCYAVEPECTTTVVLTATATDSLSPCPSEWIKWTVIVDMWGDQTGPLGGPADYEYSSFVPEDTGPYQFPWDDDNNNGIMDMRLGNGGTWNQFDGLPPGTFATSPGQELILTLPENTQGSKNNHTATWKAYDGCGNVMSHTETFQVVDKKPPTPYCINLSTALMENGGVELWACDFDNGSFDNCTSHDWLRFSFGEADVPVDSNPNYDPDSRCTSREFTCDDFENSAGGIVEVSMYVWDECGNFDYCIVNLRLVDNQGACDSVGSRGAIAGYIATEDGRSVENVEVEVMNDVMSEYPATDMTDTNGSYAFMDNPMYMDYDVSALKDDDYLNGVSTLDLVLIQKHILGLKQLDSGYKMIAADVNNDEGVSAIDLIELRKLILGIYTELPSNDSWRFSDAHEAVSLTNPWPFAEVINVDQLDQNMMDENFVGIKVGDVNGSVQLGFNNGTSTEGRSSDVVTFVMEDQTFAEGQVFDIAVTAENFTDVSGYQFTLAQSKVELVNVTSGAINIATENFATINNSITTSWNTIDAVTVDSDVLFTLTVKALENGSISNAFVMSSEITNAEAYTGTDFAVTKVELRNGEDTAIFELYQNEPNPFSDATIIGFNMPDNAKATISVYDVTGKVIRTITSDYAAGYNQVTVTRSDLNVASGVLYYKLESGDNTMTKKMIIIE